MSVWLDWLACFNKSVRSLQQLCQTSFLINSQYHFSDWPEFVVCDMNNWNRKNMQPIVPRMVIGMIDLRNFERSV